METDSRELPRSAAAWLLAIVGGIAVASVWFGVAAVLRYPSVDAYVAAQPYAGVDSVDRTATGTGITRAVSVTLERVTVWRSVPRPLSRTLPWPGSHASGGVGVDERSGRLFATDRDDSAVRAFGPDGLPEGAVGELGDGPLQFDGPEDVDVLPDGRIAIADTGNDRIQVLAPDGETVQTWRVGRPKGLAVGGGLLHVLSITERRILRLDAQGRLRGDTALPAVASGAVALRWLPPTNGEPARYRLALPDIGRVLELSAADGRAELVPSLPGIAASLRWGAWEISGVGDGVWLHHADGIDRARVPTDAVSDIEPWRDGALLATSSGPLLIEDLEWVVDGSRTAAGWLRRPWRIAAGDDVTVLDATSLPQWAWRLHTRYLDGAAGMDIAPPEVAGTGLIDVAQLVDSALDPDEDRAPNAGRFALSGDGGTFRFDGDRWSAWRPAEGEEVTVPIAIDAARGRIHLLDPGTETVVSMGPDLERSIHRTALGSSTAVDLAVTGGVTALLRPAFGVVTAMSPSGAITDVRVGGSPARIADDADGFWVLGVDGWVTRLDRRGVPQSAQPVAPAGGASDAAVDALGRLVIARPGGRVDVWSPRYGSRGAPPPAAWTDGEAPIDDAPCHVHARAAGAPSSVVLGEPVTLTLSVVGACPLPAAEDESSEADRIPGADRRPSVVFALEASPTSAVHWRSVRPLILAAVTHLRGAGVRVGVLVFGDRVMRVLTPGGSAADLAAGLAAIDPSGPPDVGSGMASARRWLERETGGARHLVIFTSGGRGDRAEQAGVASELAELRSDGVSTTAVLLDLPKAAIASTWAVADELVVAHGVEDSQAFLDRIARERAGGPWLEDIVLNAPLGRDVVAVGPSDVLEGRTVRWSSPQLDSPGWETELRVVPQKTGVVDLLDGSRISAVTIAGSPVALSFPRVGVHVTEAMEAPTVRPGPIASPTEGGGMPTAPATGTAEPTAGLSTPRPSGTSTMTSSPAPRFPTVTPTAPTSLPSPTLRDTPTSTPMGTNTPHVGGGAHHLAYFPLVSTGR